MEETFYDDDVNAPVCGASGLCRLRFCNVRIRAGQDSKDRRVERHVEPLCRHRRPELCGRDQDGGRGFRAAQEGLEDRRAERRSPEQARRRRQYRPAVDRQREGRCDRRYTELRRGAGGQQPRQGKERSAAEFRRRFSRPDRQGLHAEHDLLYLRHLHARQRHRQGAGPRQAATPGSFLPPIMLLVTRWNATPRPW
ncbi:hypothetical protein ACVWWR_006694 [Bradyrhizobium sp. LM3.2]